MTPIRSGPKWHRAHTTWFFEAFVLARHRPDHPPFDGRYDFLFNSYYEALGPRHARSERGLLTRPGVEEVAAYRAHVDDQVLELLGIAAADEVTTTVELGLHHEQQHQELLLMDIHHVLSRNPLRPTYGRVPWPVADSGRPGGWIERGSGLVEIGHLGDGFGFDNEGPRHTAYLHPFAVAGSLVTTRQWLEFMADGGYQRPELWMSDGWATVVAQGWRAPDHWFEVDGDWHQHDLHRVGPVEQLAPVRHVSWYEADAFARWAGARLPLEAEWEAVAPSPGEAAGGGWYGAVWQWTGSPYTAYPGFRPPPGAVGEYNGKFMVNQQVLRGSSLATPPGHARRSYRNFFPPAARWAFSGLRLARDLT